MGLIALVVPIPHRSLLLLSLLVYYITFVASQNASQSHEITDPPTDSSRLLTACRTMRPLICYAHQSLNEDFPGWLQNTTQKCERCNAGAACKSGSSLSGQHENGNRLSIAFPCAPPFCHPEYNTTEATDCINAVDFDRGKVYFPFNLCTRGMVALGDCNERALSKKAWVPDGGSFITEYLAQCDAGFVVPSVVTAAYQEHKGASTARPALTCVPSLQQAAGYLKDDPSPLHHYPYDVADLKDFIYCEKGGRPNKTSSCEPLPLCIDGNKTLPTSPLTSDEVNLASECELPCKYQYGRMEYNDCVFLDIVNASARKFYSARRAMSGPYAELMDEEENVKVHIVPSTSQPPAETRHSRQTDSGEKIRYPRCINSIKLSPDDRKRVEKDLMLNCATNIFVQTLGDEGLIIQPPLCDGDDDIRICWNRTVPGMGNGTSWTPEAETLPYWPYAGGVVVFITLLIVGATAYILEQRKHWFFKLRAVPLPAFEMAENIVLKRQLIVGNWLENFEKVISGKPPPVKPGTLRFATNGHIAYQVTKSDQKLDATVIEMEPTPTKPKMATQGIVKSDVGNVGEGDEGNQQLKPPAAKPITIKPERLAATAGSELSGTEVAKKFLQRLADEDLVSMSNREPYIEFDQGELTTLFEHAKKIVMKRGPVGVLHITGATWVIGDIHGDFNTIARVFRAYSTDATPGQKMLFLGDIIDRGKRQVMSLLLVVSAFVLYPETVFYLTGNHESSYVHCDHGFCDELQSAGYKGSVYVAMRGFFECLPVVAVLDKRIIAMHGGLGPEITAEELRRGFDPQDGLKHWLIEAITWSDPSYLVQNYELNKSRSGGWFFGLEAIEEARQKLGIQFIVRAHQEMNTGVRFFGDWLISVYTACWRGSYSDDGGWEERRRLIIEQDETNTPEIGGVLVYDGCETFKMIHFVPVQKPYKSHAEFAAAFAEKIKNDLAFSENNFDCVASPFKKKVPEAKKAEAADKTTRIARAATKVAEETVDRTQEDPTDAEAKP